MNSKLATPLSIVSLILVIILFVLHFSNSKPETQPVVESEAAVYNDTTQQTFGGNFPIAYVNLDSLVQNYALYKKLDAEFASKQMTQEQRFSSKRRKLEEDAYDLQTKAQKGLITSADYQQEGMALQAREQELMQESQKITQELGKEEARLMEQIKDSVLATIKDFNINKNFEIILNNAFSSSVLYSKDRHNITDTIEVLLNIRYEKATSKK